MFVQIDGYNSIRMQAVIILAAQKKYYKTLKGAKIAAFKR